MRASQINGCAYCLACTASAREHGETEQRIYLLSAWQELPLYSPRERAALAWTDSLTRCQRASREEAMRAAGHFYEKEVVDLTVLIGMINLWNRSAMSLSLPIPRRPDPVTFRHAETTPRSPPAFRPCTSFGRTWPRAEELVARVTRQRDEAGTACLPAGADEPAVALAGYRFTEI